MKRTGATIDRHRRRIQTATCRPPHVRRHFHRRPPPPRTRAVAVHHRCCQSCWRRSATTTTTTSTRRASSRTTCCASGTRPPQRQRCRPRPPAYRVDVDRYATKSSKSRTRDVCDVHEYDSAKYYRPNF